jgi:hypothetical protein
MPLSQGNAAPQADPEGLHFRVRFDVINVRFGSIADIGGAFADVRFKSHCVAKLDEE